MNSRVKPSVHVSMAVEPADALLQLGAEAAFPAGNGEDSAPASAPAPMKRKKTGAVKNRRRQAGRPSKTKPNARRSTRPRNRTTTKSSSKTGLKTKTKRSTRQMRKRPAKAAVSVPAESYKLTDEGGPMKSLDQRYDISGYEQGYYEGGEMLLERLVPPHALLPEVSLEQVLAAGVEAFSPHMHPLLDVGTVYEELTHAIDHALPYAVVRLGDGELLALAQEHIYDAQTLQREAPFLTYAGLTPPDLHARDQLAEAVRHAQVVGLPKSRQKNFGPLMYPALRHLGIPIGELRKTTSTINYELQQHGLLVPLLQGRRLLIIGNAAPEFAQSLRESGFVVSSVISPVMGFADIERVMAEVRHAEFDLALVSAGIPAVVICWRIAAECSKPALDFGHMADQLASGKVQFAQVTSTGAL